MKPEKNEHEWERDMSITADPVAEQPILNDKVPEETPEGSHGSEDSYIDGNRLWHPGE